MKKLKLNLDKKAIQDFFIRHVEKVLLVAVTLCFLLFVYRAVGRETFKRTPQELKSNADSARKRVEDTKPSPPEVPDYPRLVQQSSEPFDVGPYQHRHLWRPLIVEPPPKRGEPLLHKVKDLRGAAGHGAVNVAATRGMGEFMAAPGIRMRPGDSIRGERWIVLTGLVPVVDQYKAYYEAFKNVAGKQRGSHGAQGPEMMAPGRGSTGIDIPTWVHYHVERALVTSPGQSVDDLPWQPIHVRNAKIAARKDWGAGSGPVSPYRGGGGVVSPMYLYPGGALDFPTPPLVGRWELGEDFAHAPEIPLLPKVKPVMGPDGRLIVGPAPGEERPAEKPPTEAAPEAKPSDQPADAPGREDMPGLPGGRHGMQPGMEPGMMGPEVMGPGMMGEEAFGPEMMPGMQGMGPQRLLPGQKPAKPSPYRLFRFVDRTVEPGKHYRYRVRLMLLNPNYKKDPRFLERLDLGKELYIMTDWSDPTGVVQVPRDDRLLVAAVRPAARAAAVPEAKVVLLKWLNDKGIEADKVFLTGQSEKAWRGQMLDLSGCKWPEDQAKRKAKAKTKAKTKGKRPGPPGMPGEDLELLMGAGQPPGPHGAGGTDLYGRAEEEPIDVDYLTESLIVDMRGGERTDLSGQGRPPSSRDSSLNAPGEILVLDPEGDLVVRSELDDAAEYKELEDRKKEPTDGRMQPGMYPGAGMEMMPGEEGLMMPPGPPAKGKPKRPPRERQPKKR